MRFKRLVLSSVMGLLAMAAAVSGQEEKGGSGLIVNGELAPGATGNIPHWSGWGLKPRPLDEDGVKGCRLILPEKTSNGWFSSASMALKPGKEYYFAFKVRKTGECRLIPFLVVANRESKKKTNLSIKFFPMADGIREISEWTEFFGTVKVPDKADINSGFVHFYVDRNQENTVKFASTDEKHVDLSGLQLREL